MRSEYVSASEIQEYVYCKRAWWLRLHEDLPVTKQMAAGTLAHEQLARSVKGYSRKKMTLLLVLVSLFVLLVLVTIVTIVFSL